MNPVCDIVRGVDHSVLAASQEDVRLLERKGWFTMSTPAGERDIERSCESDSKDCPEGVGKSHWLHAEAERKWKKTKDEKQRTLMSDIHTALVILVPRNLRD